jgi:hypothetical protein
MALSKSSQARSNRLLALKQILTDCRFWRLAPLSATCIGAPWALQGL